VRAHDCLGKAVALALLSVSLSSCGNLFSDQVDAEALGAEANKDVRAFYEARQWQPAWDDGAQKQLIEALDGAPMHGLKTDLFLKGEIPKDRNEREAALTKAALRYASALATGYSDPKKVNSEVYTVKRPKLDAPAGLNKALEDGKLADWFASLAPNTDEYRTLSQEFVRYTRLNGSHGSAEAGERARQIAVNLERLRWLDRDPPSTRIDVNTAAAFLEYRRDGVLRDRRNVVVGQPDWETPQLGSPIFQLVAHPIWRVPDSILEDELKEKSPAYLAAQGMEWRDDRLVQLPGPKNSLGQVKFDMRNDQAIYLHDTPAKALFGLPERHRSHGCVRVQDALGFAFLLAHDDGILMDFQEAMTKGEETFVKMKTEVPVRLMYRTAFLDDGKVRFLEDTYGWDDDVAYALGYVRKPPRAKVKHVGDDVGP
jgi:murein L,D-transpeptidase YcbB/YkuD